MPRRVLLLSNATQYNEGLLETNSDLLKHFYSEFNANKVLYIPYALVGKERDKQTKRLKNRFSELDFELITIDEYSTILEAINAAEGFFVGGGNTYLLLKSLYDFSLIKLIRHRVLVDGIPYVGSSAGSNVATVNICTTNDMAVVWPPSLQALALVPFGINPHYVDEDPDSKHMGETRDNRIQEYLSFPGRPAVVGLYEGSALKIEDDEVKLFGERGAKVFFTEEKWKKYNDGAFLNFLLQPGKQDDSD